jgi:hypothetical protein
MNQTRRLVALIVGWGMWLGCSVPAQNLTTVSEAALAPVVQEAQSRQDGARVPRTTDAIPELRELTVPGAEGPSSVKPRSERRDSDVGVPIEDRWRIGFPEWNRYEKGSILNPYRLNVLKGDYPILGQHTFLVLTFESITFVDGRRTPLPQDINARRPGAAEFFGRGGQFLNQQNFVTSVELFHGDTAFKPPDWRIKFTPVFNLNYLAVRENGIVNRDVRKGTTRFDTHIGFQEAFAEVRLGDTPRLFPFLRGRGSRGGHSPFFDSTSLRVGVQQFNSDFRGLIFDDFNLGARLFGNFRDNKWQFNAAFFYMLEKDTNSGINTFDQRNQRVWVANLYRQDFIKPGYTMQLSVHYNDDQPSIKFDQNRFLVRPAQVGPVTPHSVKAGYIGWTGNGHFRRLNINHAFYQVLGRDSLQPIAGRPTRINAQLAALELSYDRDWQRFQVSGFFSSGDANPTDRVARGFDSILDNQFFAGGENSFWNSQEIRLTRAGVALVTQNSLIPSLRSSKLQGQANFVNPGIIVANLGYEANLTPKLKLLANLNYLRFHHTESLQLLTFQRRIRNNVGIDYGVGIVYRPLLSENMIVKGGFSVMNPLDGFKDIFTSNCSGLNCGAQSRFLFSLYAKAIFTF